MSVQVSMKELLEAGAHFGHQTSRWNPKMKPYIFGKRNGIHIIDLQKTISLFRNALNYVEKEVSNGKDVLFVGTKRQARDIVAEHAKRCGMYYVNYRWLGGTLTNFKTIKRTIQKLKRIETMKTDGTYEALTKKEVIKLERLREKLENNLGGIKDMPRIPQIVFLLDPSREHIALQESLNLKAKIIGVTDTNCSPDNLDYIIPGNDDSIRTIELFVRSIADACIEGKNSRRVPSGEALKEKGEDIEYKASGNTAVEKLKDEVADVRETEEGVGPQ